MKMKKPAPSREDEDVSPPRSADVVRIAYSYIRFSSLKQMEGDSLRRQIEMAETYCQRQSWTLNTATYRDLGVSAWRGKNADVGNLGEFLRAIESGAVQPGSALIVESLDRITRQGIDEGYDLIKKILKAGVLLITLLPEREFDVSATKSLSRGALEIQLILERAAEESERKSDRLGSLWKEKRRRAAANREPIASQVPAWLRLVDGKIVADESDKAIIKHIFALVAGGYGITALTKKLNADAIRVIGGGKNWARSSVANIISNRAVLGEYQPYTRYRQDGKRRPVGEPIPGYYPAMITDKEWNAAKAGLASRRGKCGRPPKKGFNLFAHLLRDARDGGTLIMDKSRDYKGLDPVLMSYNATKGVPGSVMSSFPFLTFERAILSQLREIDPRDILSPIATREDRVPALEQQQAGIQAEIGKLKNRLQAHYSDAVADVLERQEAEWKRLQEEKVQAQQEAAAIPEQSWKACHNLIDALDSAPDQEDTKVRLRAALRRIVESIWCLFVGIGRDRLALAQVYFRGEGKGESYRSYLIVHRGATGGAVGKRPARWYADSYKAMRDADGLPEAVEVERDGKIVKRKCAWDDPLTHVDLRDPQHAKVMIRCLKTYPRELIESCLEKGQDV
jgi:DNA invertase Pin-like site-specific DNA recombinase